MNEVLADRYRLERRIGGGGAASVWRAIDTRLGRPVAVKRLHARLRDDDRYAERFAREAEVVSAFDHPGIVSLYDRGEDDSGSFLVFELIEGEDLKALVGRTGRLLPETAADACAQVADALAYAHRRGVVHRDVKSQNVMITRDGRAKLTDFGIAYLLDIEGQSELTRTGTLVGTTDYLSPEQATGRAVDARADVYALGIVLFECLTGQLPFAAENPLALALRHVQDPLPDPRELVPEIPPHLSLVVKRAAAKDPADRFQTAAGFASALRDASNLSVRGATLLMPEIDFTSRPSDELGRTTVTRSGDTIGATAEVETSPEPFDAIEETTGPMRLSEMGRPDDTVIRRRRVALGAGAAVCAAAIVVGVILKTSGGSGNGIGPLQVASVQTEDPAGDGENDAEAPLAIDGNTATSWSTERYKVAELSALNKNGVGLRLNLATPAVARALVLTSPTPGASYQVFATSGQGDASRTLVATGTTTDGRQRIDLDTRTVSTYYVVWFVTLPASRQGGFRASVAEVELEGTAKPG